MICSAEKKLLSLNRSHLCISVFISIILKRWIQKDTAVIYVKEYSMFSSRSFIVPFLTFRSLIHFEFIFVYGMKNALISLFHRQLSSFPSTIYWRDCLFSMVYSCLLHCRLIDSKSTGLFLNFLSHSIDLCVFFYVNTIVFWSLQVCSIIWSQGLTSSVLTFFLNIALAIQGLSCFHAN